MRKQIRNGFIFLLTLGASAALLCGCKAESTNGNVTISLPEMPADLCLELGTEYTLPNLFATDSNGKTVAATRCVYTLDGEKLAIENGKLMFLEVGEYGVVYTYAADGVLETASYKITVSDTLLPTITSELQAVNYLAQGSELDLSGITATKNGNACALTLSASFKESETAIDNGLLLLNERGRYEIKAAATDAHGNTAIQTYTVFTALDNESGEAAFGAVTSEISRHGNYALQTTYDTEDPTANKNMFGELKILNDTWESAAFWISLDEQKSITLQSKDGLQVFDLYGASLTAENNAYVLNGNVWYHVIADKALLTGASEKGYIDSCGLSFQAGGEKELNVYIDDLQFIEASADLSAEYDTLRMVKPKGESLVSLSFEQMAIKLSSYADTCAAYNVTYGEYGLYYGSVVNGMKPFKVEPDRGDINDTTAMRLVANADNGEIIAYCNTWQLKFLDNSSLIYGYTAQQDSYVALSYETSGYRRQTDLAMYYQHESGGVTREIKVANVYADPYQNAIFVQKGCSVYFEFSSATDESVYLELPAGLVISETAIGEHVNPSMYTKGEQLASASIESAASAMNTAGDYGAVRIENAGLFGLLYGSVFSGMQTFQGGTGKNLGGPKYGDTFEVSWNGERVTNTLAGGLIYKFTATQNVFVGISAAKVLGGYYTRWYMNIYVEDTSGEKYLVERSKSLNGIDFTEIEEICLLQGNTVYYEFYTSYATNVTNLPELVFSVACEK